MEAATQMNRQSEWQEHQAALTQLNLFKAVFSSMLDAVVVYDPAWKVLHMNTAALTLFEVRAETSYVGMSYDQFMQSCDVFDEQLQPYSLERMQRVASGEEGMSAKTSDVIVRFPSGRELQLSTSYTPVVDQQGQMSGHVCVFRDVTEHRQKERHIQSVLNSLLHLVDVLEDLPGQIDASVFEAASFTVPEVSAAVQHFVELVAQTLNCQRVLLIAVDVATQHFQLVASGGLTPAQKEHYDKNTSPYTVFDYMNAETIARLQANEPVVISHAHFVTLPAGQTPELLPLSTLLSPIVVDNRLIGGFVISGHGAHGDTHTKEEIALVRAVAKLVLQFVGHVCLLKKWVETQANELMLQETNRRFNEFLSLASHELKTPLTTIMGNMQLALRRLQTLQQSTEMSPAQFNESIERVQRPLTYAVQRAVSQDRLISDLLDASRIQADRLALHIKPCNLAEVVRDVVANQQVQTPNCTLRLEIGSAEDAVSVVADAERIGQVVNNYITNAFKYAPAGRPVIVRLTVEDTRARVSVLDEGPGIASDEHTRIWERFYRVKDVGVKNGHDLSLGLGLYLCKRIVELHNGEVGVHSVPAAGATFWFTLPLAR